MGQIRVGRIIYSGQRDKGSYPSYPGFTPIVVLTRSSEYGSLGPYELKDEQGRIMENLWQFAKFYPSVPAVSEPRSRFDPTPIWTHPAEGHLEPPPLASPGAPDGKERSLRPNSAYWSWRERGMNAPEAIRYPVGRRARSTCLGAILSRDTVPPLGELGELAPLDSWLLDYVGARRQIYLPLYCHLVRQQPQFAELQGRLAAGENLLIIEVDGPHQESLDYYHRVYGVNSDFIVDSTLLVTPENIRIMLWDTKHPFGHGYCLAMALLEWS
jgi:hypothetical protein